MHKNKLNLNLSQIKKMYLEKDMSTYQIAKAFGCSAFTIGERLKEMDINRRTQAECNKHRIRNNPDWANKVSKGLHFKGSSVSHGYKLIYCPEHPMATKTKYVREHRLVAEDMLGRYLTSEEEVHHIDFNPLNNESDNLYVFSSKGEHTNYHFMLRSFVKEALAGGM